MHNNQSMVIEKRLKDLRFATFHKLRCHVPRERKGDETYRPISEFYLHCFVSLQDRILLIFGSTILSFHTLKH